MKTTTGNPEISGEAIRALRRSLGDTQETFAERLGLKSWETISRWETGATHPGESDRRKLHGLLLQRAKSNAAAEFGGPEATLTAEEVARLWSFLIAHDAFAALCVSLPHILLGTCADPIEPTEAELGESKAALEAVIPGAHAEQVARFAALSPRLKRALRAGYPETFANYQADAAAQAETPADAAPETCNP